MLAVYTEPQKTPLTFEQAVACMRWALKSRIGSDPTDEVLALALAKTALETGRWIAIWNANWGNVKASDTYEGQFTCITLNECLVRNGKTVTVWFAPEGELSANPAKGGKLIGPPVAVPPGHPQTRMRAFANEFDGVDQYVDFVANGRYKKAWAALLTGNAMSYVHELKVAGYFTAPESAYVTGVAALQHEFLSTLRGLPDVPKADIEWERLKESVPNLQFLVQDIGVLLQETPPSTDQPNV
jgi:hypothetical protein